MSTVDDVIERAEREYAAHESGILLSNRDVADRLMLAAEVKRLRAQVAAVEALCRGPASSGYRPYAVNVDGEVIFAVGLDDLRAVLQFALVDPRAKASIYGGHP